MIVKKIPRKLKKRVKKELLNRHSEDYRKYRRMTTKNIRLLYMKTEERIFGFDYVLKK